jgi:hypothetical protein
MLLKTSVKMSLVIPSGPGAFLGLIRGTHVLSQHTKLDTLINLTFPRIIA